MAAVLAWKDSFGFRLESQLDQSTDGLTPSHLLAFGRDPLSDEIVCTMKDHISGLDKYMRSCSGNLKETVGPTISPKRAADQHAVLTTKPPGQLGGFFFMRVRRPAQLDPAWKVAVRAR
jgi:hypothetical protein